MSTIIINTVKKGFFLDSVALMRFSREISRLEGVEEAALMMGTPSNKEIMKDAGILTEEGTGAAPGDLIIGIRAVNRDVAERALEKSGKLLEGSSKGDKKGEAWRPKTLSAAVKSDPQASLALISVAGEFAVSEARKALNEGLNVMIFSDNVPLSDEIQLKEEARELGLLVMGPDCGTAIIDGVPLAFANNVNRGDIGIVGASGTGMQDISCLISRGGGGISQAVGVGGRDLKEEVGGISTLMALDALEQDPATRHIVLVSKPPSVSVVSRIVEKVKMSEKSFTVCFLGMTDLELPENATFAPTLRDAALSALGGPIEGEDFDPVRLAVRPPEGRKGVAGLFSGGTLCAEAQFVFCNEGEKVCSNVAIPGAVPLSAASEEHRFIDLGDDEHTCGRPHPMIEPAVRDELVYSTILDKRVGVILVDLVLGWGAHEDPAGHLLSGLGSTGNGRPVLIASVTGTDQDIQNRSSQVQRLQEAGILVAPSNADAALLALACLEK